MLVVSSCDERYIPLAKGLFLSLLRGLGDQTDVRLGFVDLGCSKTSINWMRDRGVLIRRPDPTIMGALAAASFGSRRGQTCRPFLPRLFPDADCIAWMDADMWVQEGHGLLNILRAAAASLDHVFACPEFHFSYTRVLDTVTRAKEIYNLNRAFFDADIASEMSTLPVYNSGFVVASRDHPLWEKWAALVSGIYLDTSHEVSPTALHFGEQVAFNRCVHKMDSIHPFDPLYNYLCLWSPPFRDSSGIVRLSAPPQLPIGVIHLAGGWSFFGRKYLQARLLFDEGRYLSAKELASLTAAAAWDGRYARPTNADPVGQAKA